MRLKGVGVDGDEKSPLNTSSSGSSPVALWLVLWSCVVAAYLNLEEGEAT